MESELSGIFRVKLVTKNIVRGSPGTQFMHMRVNRKLGDQGIWLTEAASPTIFRVNLSQWVHFTFYMSQLKPRVPKCSNRIERNQLEE